MFGRTQRREDLGYQRYTQRSQTKAQCAHGHCHAQIGGKRKVEEAARSANRFRDPLADRNASHQSQRAQQSCF